MITRSAGSAGGPAAGARPTSRIVRTSGLAWPALAGLAVLAAVALAAPREAWVPYASGPASAAAWDAPVTSAQGLMTAWQSALGRLIAPTAPVTAAIMVAAVFAAAAITLLGVALAHAGLSPLLASLLALVAAAAPLAAWQSSSPLGAAPLALASTVGLWWLVTRKPTPSRPPGLGATVAMLSLLALAEATARWRQESSLADTLRILRGDLGLPGLVLLVPWFAVPAATVRRRVVWLGLAATALITAPLPGLVRAGVLLPWAWWIAGATLARLITERGTAARRWGAVALVVWAALHAAQVPWGHQRQQAALVRSWADGVAARVTAESPLVTTSTARDLLARAVVSRTAQGPSPVVDVADAPAAAARQRRPLIVSRHVQEHLRWQGLALGEVEGGMGASLERLLDGLPHGMVTVAVIAQETAARLSPAQWQALGTVGLRLADAGQPRAHAVVGMTEARVGGLEAAQAGSVRLDVQPGDPLGRMRARSPVDLRLEADAARVSVWLRGQPVIERETGMALLFFSTRGDFLAWRSGPDPDRLAGPPLGNAPLVQSQGLVALPCVDMQPGVDTHIGALASLGALGVSVQQTGGVQVALTRPDATGDPVRLATRTTAGGPVLTAGTRAAASVTFPTAGVTGLLLRGPVTAGVARASVPARICAAWPMLHPVSLARGAFSMAVAPSLDPLFGRGWHDAELEPGGGHFRWMSGGSADLLFAFHAPPTLVFAVDAQAPEAPRDGDTVHLAVNGHDEGVRALQPTRGLYEWHIVPAHLRAGPNTFTLTTTRTRRPADGQAGADPRLLGLLVRGWTFTPLD